jgi:hypothetical protein
MIFPRRKAKTSNYQGYMKQHEDTQKKDTAEESQENIPEVIAPEIKEKIEVNKIFKSKSLD